MISIVNLTAGYDGTPVLKGVNASLEAGKIHGLVGLNGSGKTTLLRVLSSIIKPFSGSVQLAGHTPGRNEVAFLESDNYFYHYITGAEYLSLFETDSGFQNGPWLEVFNIPGDKYIDEYSTGMKKKLAFLAAVASSRPVLLLDEPFNGLDMESVRVLSLVLQRMREKGKTIIVTSHILGSLTELCDTILFLRDGITSRTFEGHSASEIEQEVFKELDVDMKEKINRLPGL